MANERTEGHAHGFPYHFQSAQPCYRTHDMGGVGALFAPRLRITLPAQVRHNPLEYSALLPVRQEDVLEHEMEGEWACITEATAAAIAAAKREGRRVVAVGTTTTRALESAAQSLGEIKAGEFWAHVFIYPGFQFQVIDALLTNFHLPCSTLLMLVSALAGRERIIAAYEEAVRERYRFFSYGDAMLIL